MHELNAAIIDIIVANILSNSKNTVFAAAELPGVFAILFLCTTIPPLIDYFLF